MILWSQSIFNIRGTDIVSLKTVSTLARARKRRRRARDDRLARRALWSPVVVMTVGSGAETTRSICLRHPPERVRMRVRIPHHLGDAAHLHRRVHRDRRHRQRRRQVDVRVDLADVVGEPIR